MNKLSPFEQMRRMYRQHPQERPFDLYLDWHLRHGFVFSTPDFFVMGRPAPKALLEQILALGPSTFDRDECDCWYVHAMAGDIEKVWSILPWHLPWIAFERLRAGKRELTIVRTDRIRELSSNKSADEPIAFQATD